MSDKKKERESKDSGACAHVCSLVCALHAYHAFTSLFKRAGAQGKSFTDGDCAARRVKKKARLLAMQHQWLPLARDRACRRQGGTLLGTRQENMTTQGNMQDGQKERVCCSRRPCSERVWLQRGSPRRGCSCTSVLLSDQKTTYNGTEYLNNEDLPGWPEQKKCLLNEMCAKSSIR